MTTEQDCSQSTSQKLPDTCPISQTDLSQTLLLESQNLQEPWGRLYPVKPDFNSLELTKNEYIIGRASNCDHLLNVGECEKVNGAISKKHFKIRRLNISKHNYDDYIVYLDDLSCNGTFVNGRKVGKGHSVILESNNEISICYPYFKAFIYISSNLDVEVKAYPEDVRMKYAISRVLGNGSFGQVRLVFDKSSGKALAMKIIPKKKFCNSVKNLYDPVRTKREVDILKALSHVYVIKFENFIDSKNFMFILTEYMEGGELFDRVNKNGPLYESDAKLYFLQLAMAVRYLHSNDIIHRDIKLENILLSSKSTECLIKLSDFGFSKFLDSESVMMTYCGTPLYIAPEILKTKGTKGSYDQRADIWSMGVVLYICLSGMAPFAASDTRELTEEILRGNYSFSHKQWGKVSRGAISLVRKMLTVNPGNRISLNDILMHSWLQDKSVSMRVNRLLKSASTSQQPSIVVSDSEGNSDDENGRITKKARIGK